MKAVLEWSVSTWQDYWGDGFYQYLLLASFLYLILFRRKKRSVQQTLAFTALALFVFFCPVTARIIHACIGTDVYWRVLWLLPTIPVIALAATEFLRTRRSKLLQAALLLAGCAVIAFCGKDMASAGNYVRTNNRQKVPDEVAHVCNIILSEAAKDGVEEIRLAADEHLSTYARVYDPSIHQLYGRWCMGALNTQSKRLFRLMNSTGKRYYGRMAKVASENGCNFLVIVLPEENKAQVERYGYREIGNVSSYCIFQLEPDA